MNLILGSVSWLIPHCALARHFLLLSGETNGQEPCCRRIDKHEHNWPLQSFSSEIKEQGVFSDDLVLECLWGEVAFVWRPDGLKIMGHEGTRSQGKCVQKVTSLEYSRSCDRVV